MSEADPLYLHAERIRTSGLFGRSDQLHKLFDYLVECNRSGRVSKESVIAVEVFGRSTDFDVSSDAAARVCIHKLRRKFEEFYAAHPELGPARLTIPRGLVTSARPAHNTWDHVPAEPDRLDTVALAGQAP